MSKKRLLAFLTACLFVLNSILPSSFAAIEISTDGFRHAIPTIPIEQIKERIAENQAAERVMLSPVAVTSENPLSMTATAPLTEPEQENVTDLINGLEASLINGGPTPPENLVGGIEFLGNRPDKNVVITGLELPGPGNDGKQTRPEAETSLLQTTLQVTAGDSIAVATPSYMHAAPTHIPVVGDVGIATTVPTEIVGDLSATPQLKEIARTGFDGIAPLEVFQPLGDDNLIRKDREEISDSKKQNRVYRFFKSMGFAAYDYLSLIKQLIRNQFSSTQELMHEDDLDQYLESLNVYDVDLSVLLNDPLLADQMIVWEGKTFQITDGVEVSKAMALVHMLLHPPKHLHPYLRMLLYRRMLTPEILEAYHAKLEKMDRLYKKAKAGKGKIRYRNKVHDAFLPLPDDMGGSFEFLVPSGEPKTSKIGLKS